MVTSKEVIAFLRQHVSKQKYVGIFYAGSLPKILIPGSDLDIFLVMKHNKDQECLNELSTLMKIVQKNHTEITYSFYRGPVKYKHKGLVHFIIYSQNKQKNNPSAHFLEENRQVLANLKKSAKTIIGKHPRTILGNFDVHDSNSNKETRERWIKKYKRLLRYNRIQHREWKKIRGKWKFRYTYKQPNKYLREYLIKYYKKTIQ